ncbi:helix-turn-helix domain-containing protein [Mesorhizobium sp. NBSH29]|uniref:helix-turn-helix domain-containing protein n=1 Tax=Mesorhizobium sp. NBSH29 TaxID=2654249 RepID=UPI001896A421|nr:helix-turn-helix transcriptional regulator [Mesorhizobium sp. NBSH29]QPC87607.1 helix-turn-helix domain-containing protein [Mesorhizobium sp. NBSH29]
MSDAMNIYEEIPDLDTIGGRISRARDAAGLSVKEIAWQLGVKIATINAWESDRSLPGSHRMNRLAGMMGVSISWLLHGVGTAPAEANSEQTVDNVTSQLEKLKLLHVETGELIGRIQKDLDGISPS